MTASKEKTVDKIRVLMVGTSVDAKGGVATVLNNIMGSELTSLCEVKHVATHGDGSIPLRIYIALTSFFVYLYALVTFNPKIVHLHVSSKGSFYRKSILILIAKLFNKKVVYHHHCGSFMMFYQEGSNNWKKRYIEHILSISDIIIVLTHSWISSLATIAPNANFVVLNNAVDCPPLREPRNNETPRILFMGGLHPAKGLHELLAAFRKLSDLGIPFHGRICGHGDLDYWQGQANTLAVSDQVSFPGWVSGATIAQEYEKADIFVLPSFSEALPMSILEAMSQSVPVIATRVGGIPDLIEDGKTGLLIEPGDPIDLAKALQTLIQDKQLNRQIVVNGHNMIDQRYNLEKVPGALLHVYHELLGIGNHL